MRLPKSVRDRFRAQGRRGGRARSERMTAGARQRVARLAAVRRWIRVRFGAPDFETLGLPGGQAVDRGLATLAAGGESMESLMVSLAAPRLKREGVPLTGHPTLEADKRLYRLLEVASGDLAHARYLACLRQMASFADACAHHRLRRSSDSSRSH